MREKNGGDILEETCWIVIDFLRKRCRILPANYMF